MSKLDTLEHLYSLVKNRMRPLTGDVALNKDQLARLAASLGGDVMKIGERAVEATHRAENSADKSRKLLELAKKMRESQRKTLPIAAGTGVAAMAGAGALAGKHYAENRVDEHVNDMKHKALLAAGVLAPSAVAALQKLNDKMTAAEDYASSVSAPPYTINVNQEARASSPIRTQFGNNRTRRMGR